MKTRKFFCKSVFLSLLLSAALSSCGNLRSSDYRFPDEALSGLVPSDADLFLPGFASDLCVPEDSRDKDISGVDGEAFGLFSLSTGEVLSQHNIYEKMYPASTTKILTCLLALKYGDPSDLVTVPEEARISVSGSSMAGLSPGDVISFYDLLYALMVPSGNDAAVTIATYISGSESAFAELMNEEARRLGATKSHFVNPNGLPDDDHYTTVYDMYLIFNEALRYDEFREIASTYSYSCTINTDPGSLNDEKTLSWTCGNAFLSGKFSFAEGMEILAGKTGHTNSAGFCLVLGEEDGKGDEYISIIFNSYIYEELYASMRNLAAKAS